MAYVVQSDVEAKMGANVLRQITDDDQDGVADAAAVARLIADGEAIFNGKLRGIYDLPLSEPYDALVVTIVLDIILGLAAQRHPALFRFDGGKRLEAALKMLDMIREDDMQLDHARLGPEGGGFGVPEVFCDDPDSTVGTEESTS